jgi:hypothetical protein
MSRVSDFYSIKECQKTAWDRVFHNNSECPSGRNIPQPERTWGTGGYRLCDDCSKLNSEERRSKSTS